MKQFVQNPTHFSVDCAQKNGQCSVVQKNIIFLDDGKELAAVDYLQNKCGYVVIIPDASYKEKALLYHTSCARMSDVVSQIFQDCLEAPVSLPQSSSEMTVGELHRRCVNISYDECRARVECFGFRGAEDRDNGRPQTSERTQHRGQ